MTNVVWILLSVHYRIEDFEMCTIVWTAIDVIVMGQSRGEYYQRKGIWNSVHRDNRGLKMKLCYTHRLIHHLTPIKRLHPAVDVNFKKIVVSFPLWSMPYLISGSWPL